MNINDVFLEIYVTNTFFNHPTFFIKYMNIYIRTLLYKVCTIHGNQSISCTTKCLADRQPVVQLTSPEAGTLEAIRRVQIKLQLI
jgi:hypothetical protein